MKIYSKLKSQQLSMLKTVLSFPFLNNNYSISFQILAFFFFKLQNTLIQLQVLG